MKSAALLISSLLFAIVPVSTLSSDEGERQVAALVPDQEKQELRNQSAIAVILGDIRANLSDLIFIKTERYLHSGVAYLPHLDTEEMVKSGNIQARKQDKPAVHHHHEEGEDHSHSHEEEAVVTVIRPPEEDFRGFVGDLEREVKPWLPPGSPDVHTKGTELLPWYRLATLGNPRNERAYMIGAWWLKSLQDEKMLHEAVKFLEEGIANNPDSFQLMLMKGYAERQLERDEQAWQTFVKAGELALQVRPPEGKGPDWSDHLDEQASAAILMAILSTRDVRSPKEALELARQFQARSKGPLPGSVLRVMKDLEKAA